MKAVAMLVSASFIVFGSFHCFQMNLLDIVIVLFYLMLLHLVGLRKEWGPIGFFVRNVTIFTAGIVIVGVVVNYLYDFEYLIVLGRWIVLGLVSAVALLPSVLDTAMGYAKHNRDTRVGLAEGIILYRNYLPVTYREFRIGIQLASKNHEFKGISRISQLIRLAVIIVAELPETSTNLLISTYVRKFKAGDTVYLVSMRASALLWLMGGTIYFALRIVLSNIQGMS